MSLRFYTFVFTDVVVVFGYEALSANKTIAELWDGRFRRGDIDLVVTIPPTIRKLEGNRRGVVFLSLPPPSTGCGVE